MDPLRRQALAIAESLAEFSESEQIAALDKLSAQGRNRLREEIERLLRGAPELETRLGNLNIEPSEERFSEQHDLTPDQRPIRDPGRDSHKVIDRYHIIERIGSGGMGEVYLAEQRAPIRRKVALKVIKKGLDTREVLERFEVERQTLAKLDHPHIARVLDAGITPEGQSFFVMEYVPGEPLTEFCDRHRLPMRQRMELFRETCEAMVHAHARGVIHRDIKPSNLLAWKEEGVYQVKVIDFGVAKALSKDGGPSGVTSITQHGVILGTFEFMSPEQAGGQGDVDIRSDIYSLGVVLYELLSGIKAFEKPADRATTEAMHHARETSGPMRPSTRLRRDAPNAALAAEFRGLSVAGLIRILENELEWIPLKAMRPDRERRYQTAQELIADLDHYHAGMPLSAGPESTTYRLRKFIRRHHVSLTVAVTLLLLLVVGTLGTSVGMYRAREAKHLADWRAYQASMQAAEAAWQARDIQKLTQVLENTAPEFRGWEWKWMDSSARKLTEIRLAREPGEFFRESIAATGDQAWAVAEAGPSEQWSHVVLWDVRTGERLRTEAATSLAVSPTGDLYALVTGEGILQVRRHSDHRVRWEAPSLADGRRWHLGRWAFSPDGRSLVASGTEKSLNIFDVTTGARQDWDVPVEPTKAWGFVHRSGQPGGDVIFSTARSGSFALNMATGRYEANDTYFVARRRISLLDARFEIGVSRARVLTFDGKQAVVEWNYFEPGSLNERSAYLVSRGALAVGRLDGTIELLTLYEPGSAQILTRPLDPPILFGGKTSVLHIDSTPDDQRLLITTVDGEQFAIEASIPYRVWTSNVDYIETADYSPDRSRVATGSWGGLNVLDTTTGLMLWQRNLTRRSVQAIAWSPDGKKIATASKVDDRPSWVFILDSRTGEVLKGWCPWPGVRDAEIEPREAQWAGPILALSYNSDGSALWVLRTDGTLSSVSASTWRELDASRLRVATPTDGTPFSMGSLHISPDGRHIAAVAQSQYRTPRQDAGLLVVDTTTHREVFRRAGLTRTPIALAWENDPSNGKARTLIVLSVEGQHAVIERVSMLGGQSLSEVRVPRGQADASVTSLDAGKRIAAAGKSGKLTLIDVASGTVVTTFGIPHQLVVRMAETPAGALLLTTRGWEAKAVIRMDLDTAESSLARTLANWPDDCPKPRTTREAREWVAAAHNEILDLRRQGWDPLEHLTTKGKSPESLALIRSIARRSEPLVAQLNSAALQLWDDPRTMERSERLFRLCLKFEPTMPRPHANYSYFLIKKGQWNDAAIQADEAIRKSALHGMPPDPDVHLMRAIAHGKLNLPDARTQWVEAVDRLRRAGQLDAPEYRELLDKGRQIHGNPER